jgi:hypothetical protein
MASMALFGLLKNLSSPRFILPVNALFERLQFSFVSVFRSFKEERIN